MTGRHAQPTPPPTPPRHAWALRPIAAAAAGILIAAGTGAGWHATWAPTVQPTAVALPTAERSDDTGARAARGFPALVRPTIVPTDVTPWSEDDGPVAFYGQPLPTRAAPASVAASVDRPTPGAALAAADDVVIGAPPIYAPPAPTEPAPPVQAGEPTPEPADPDTAEPTPSDPATPTDETTPPADPEEPSVIEQIVDEVTQP